VDGWTLTRRGASGKLWYARFTAIMTQLEMIATPAAKSNRARLRVFICWQR
jgi:hypothetical protein